MRVLIAAGMLTLLAGRAFAAPGDVIRTFTLAGQPAQGPRGVAKDWTDGNIWVAGPEATADVKLGKFDAISASLIASWRPMPGAQWCFDIGYPYAGHLVHVDSGSPRLRLWTTAGSYVGSLPDPFASGYDTGCGCNAAGSTVYATNTSSTVIRRYNGSSWGTFAMTNRTPNNGVAVGWGHVWVARASPSYDILQYNTNGSLERSFSLSGSTSPSGLCTGRVNANGPNETLFMCVPSPNREIHEIEIGDVYSTAVAPASLGNVKALLK